MTEKITAVIGLTTQGKKQTPAEIIKFLSDTFEISHNRAAMLRNNMAAAEHSYSNTTVVLTYRQLARYVALRAVQAGTGPVSASRDYLWSYPRVITFVEEDVQQPAPVVELRPGFRRV